MDAKLSGSTPAPVAGGANPTASSVVPSGSTAPPSGAPSADMLYQNGLRDIQGGKYDLARSEFLDYLKYYSSTDLASNAQFYLGEIAYQQKKYDQAVSEYDKVLNNYPKSFKLAPAQLHRAMAFIELGQKSSGIRELREIVKRYPGTEEDRRARAKLKELGATITPAR
jgi:tol-pal system protein YbgF